MTELDHETFDIVEFLAGVNYPKDEIEVFLDERVMYLLHKATTELQRLEAIDTDEAREQVETLRKSVQELREQAAAVKVKIEYQAIPREVQDNFYDEACEKYPEERNMLTGNVIPNVHRQELHDNLMWAAHVTKITAPSGAVQTDITVEAAQRFRGYAPRAAIISVDRAIRELYAGAADGFEDAAKDVDFSSAASPEA